MANDMEHALRFQEECDNEDIRFRRSGEEWLRFDGDEFLPIRMTPSKMLVYVSETLYGAYQLDKERYLKLVEKQNQPGMTEEKFIAGLDWKDVNVLERDVEDLLAEPGQAQSSRRMLAAMEFIKGLDWD